MTVTRPKCDTIFGWVAEIEHTMKPNSSILKHTYLYSSVRAKKETKLESN